MTTSTLTWLRLYAIAGILHLLLLLADHLEGLYASKCVLMPLLVGAVWAARGYFPYRVCVFLSLALFFSWIGDIILVAAPQAQGQFLAGLVAFLLAHLLYIATFRTEIALSGGATSVRRTVIALLPLAGCIVLLLYTLRETLSHNGMWLPGGLVCFYHLRYVARGIPTLRTCIAARILVRAIGCYAIYTIRQHDSYCPLWCAFCVLPRFYHAYLYSRARAYSNGNM